MLSTDKLRLVVACLKVRIRYKESRRGKRYSRGLMFDDKGLPMTTVTIPDKYAEALRALGDVQMAVDLALQRYTIEQITAKITSLRQRAHGYEAKYGADYP